MAPAEAVLRVTVVFCPRPGAADETTLDLPAGATLAQAVAASGLPARHPGCEQLAMGVWGRVKPASTPLRDGDRVELYRPLVVDPKEARRLRYRGQKVALSGRSRRR